eukprot:SAG22_NODE_3102_length_1939_cov_2.677174_2_plen_46_part_01
MTRVALADLNLAVASLLDLTELCKTWISIDVQVLTLVSMCCGARSR